MEECSSDILDGTKIFAIKLHYRATLNPKIGEKRNYVRQGIIPNVGKNVEQQELTLTVEM